MTLIKFIRIKAIEEIGKRYDYDYSYINDILDDDYDECDSETANGSGDEYMDFIYGVCGQK